MEKWTTPTVAVAGAFLALTLILSAQAWESWWEVAHQDPNLGFAPAIPLLALGLMLIQPRHVPTRRRPGGSWLLAIGGLALHALAWLEAIPAVNVIGLVLFLLGWTTLVLPERLGARVRPGIVFLLFLVPVPLALYLPLAVQLQSFVATVTEWTLGLCQIALFREGYRLRLSGYTIDVGEACSGIRQLTAYLAMAMVVGQLARRGSRFTLGVMGLALPVAILANIVRVNLTAITFVAMGPAWADGVFHLFQGFVLIGLGAAVLLFAAAVLARWYDARQRPPSSPPPNSSHGLPMTPAMSLGRLHAIGLAVFSLLVTLGLHWFAVSSENLAPPLDPPKLAPLADFPQDLGLWIGTDQTFADRQLTVADDTLARVYQQVNGRVAARVWIAYSARGQDRYHHPQVCLTALGMLERTERRSALVLPSPGEPAMAFEFASVDRTELVAYWHYTLPLDLPAEASGWQRRYWQARRRPASVTVNLFIARAAQDDEVALRSLADAVDGALRPLLPAGSTRGSRRLPVLRVD